MVAKRFTLCGLIFCIGILCFSVWAERPALAEETITSEIKVTPKTKLSDAEFRALSEAAGRILTHVHLARLSIKKNDLNSAKEHVEKALILVKIVEKAAPKYEVEAKIKSGDATYDDKRIVEQLVIPIYAELDQTESVLLPITQAKKEAASQAAVKESPTIVDVDFVFTRASLDVGETRFYLQKALESLNNKDTDMANQILSDIQNRLVIFEYDEWDTPVVRARSYLLDALKSVENKEWNGAKNYVKEAGEALKSLKEKGGKEVSEKVKNLTDQLTALNKKIEEKKDTAKGDILSLWDKLVKGL